MRQNLSDQVFYRSILVGLVVMLLGISARPHAVESMVAKAWQLKEHAPLYASATMDEIARRYPWREELRLIAAHLALRAGDPQASIQYFEQTVTETRLDPVDWFALGDAYQMAGDSTSAEAAWQQAIQIDPALPHVYTRLVELHDSAHNYQASASDLKALLQIQPSEPENYYRLGLLLAATQPEAALVYLEQAADLGQDFSAGAAEISRRISSARLNDEPTYIFIAAGRALAAQDEWELAAEAFRQALRLRHDRHGYWEIRGYSNTAWPWRNDRNW